jgi:hypothetical protein
MYGGYRGRGRGQDDGSWGPPQPQTEAEERLPPEQYPGKKALLKVMEHPAKNLFADRTMPLIESEVPVEAPLTADYDHTREINPKDALQKGDLYEKGPRGQLQRLFGAVQAGAMRAYNLKPPFRIADKWEMVNYNNAAPESNSRENAVPVVWGPSRREVVIMGSAPNIRDFTRGKDRKGTVMSLGVEHENDCSCVLLTESNNLTFVLYSLPCLPKQLTNYVENENYREPSVAVHASEQVMLNTSMSFMSYVSKSGLATPRLLCRQPLASIARKMTPVYKPPYSNMDLGANTPLLDAIYMQFDKVDFDAFIDNWEKDHAEIPSMFEHRGWPRFHDMSIQLVTRCE